MRPVHVNPHHVKNSKELDDNNPSKNNSKDPKTIFDLVNEGCFSQPSILPDIYAEIMSLLNIWFQAPRELTRAKNGLSGSFPSIFLEHRFMRQSVGGWYCRTQNVYALRVEELLSMIAEKKGSGEVTISGFISEGDIRRFDSLKQLQKLAGYAISQQIMYNTKGNAESATEDAND